MLGKYPDRLRKCETCGERSFRGQWGLTPSGRHQTICQKCNAAWRLRKSTDNRAEAGPCLQCGKRFFVKFPSIAKRRKFCSFACGEAAQTRPKACRLCLEVKKPDDFARGKNKVRHQVCIACDRTTARNPVIGEDMSRRPAIGLVMQRARAAAVRRGQLFGVKRHHMRAFYAKPCALCGAPMTTLRAIDPTQPFEPSNMRPQCKPCSRLLDRWKFEEILLLAHAIAAHCPLEVPKNAKPDARKHP